MQEQVQQVLSDCVIDGNVVKITGQQLDRKIYEGVKKALEGIGGQWKGGKVSGFVFPADPTDLVDQLKGGERRNLKKEYQFFPTPDALADKLVALAQIGEGMEILEPSAGDGSIVRAIHRELPHAWVNFCEINPIQYESLAKMKGASPVAMDFLTVEGGTEDDKWDRIVANPPFSKNQDIDHVLSMWECLRNGGRIVTVTSTHWETSTNKKETAFREWLKKVGARGIEVPYGTFKESGTNIATKILVIDKA